MEKRVPCQTSVKLLEDRFRRRWPPFSGEMTEWKAPTPARVGPCVPPGSREPTRLRLGSATRVSAADGSRGGLGSCVANRVLEVTTSPQPVVIPLGIGLLSRSSPVGEFSEASQTRSESLPFEAPGLSPLICFAPAPCTAPKWHLPLVRSLCPRSGLHPTLRCHPPWAVVRPCTKPRARRARRISDSFYPVP